MAAAGQRSPHGRAARSPIAERSCAGSRSSSSATPTSIAEVVAAETGKSPGDARGEVGAAIEMGYFVAGEGRRFYGRTTTSAIPNRQAMTVRQPLGVAGLIIAANTPIANVAWKVFPGAPLRKRRRAEGVGGHARDGARLRRARARGGPAGRAS